MLFREHSANETFSDGRDPGDEPSRIGEIPRGPVPAARSGMADPADPAVAPGDEVVFDRLDLAEILGIWRHARGRVVGLHRPWGAAAARTRPISSATWSTAKRAGHAQGR